MSPRALLTTVTTTLALVALPLFVAHAQVRVAPPVVTLPMAPQTNVIHPGWGTGPIEVSLQTSTGTTSFGNATSFTYENPSVVGGQQVAGGAVVQFAPNDQLAQAIEQNACLLQGCPNSLLVKYSGPLGATLFALRPARMTQARLGAGGVVATFSYPQYMVRGPTTGSAASPGTGPFAVALQSLAGTASFGNASNVTFQNPQALGATGTATVQFAADDQQAQLLMQDACLMQGCSSSLIITYTSTQGNRVYTLKPVRMTQVQLGVGVLATFSYTQSMTQGPG